MSVIDLSRAYVFEPPGREVPFSEEADEMRQQAATAASTGEPLLVILRSRHIQNADAVEVLSSAGALRPEHLRCPEWLTLAHSVWVLHGSRIHVVKDGDAEPIY